MSKEREIRTRDVITAGRTIQCRDRRTMSKEREIRTQIYLDGNDKTEIITQRR